MFTGTGGAFRWNMTVKSQQSQVKVSKKIYKILGVEWGHVGTLSSLLCVFCEWLYTLALISCTCCVHFAHQLKVSNTWYFLLLLLISATGEKSVKVWWNFITAANMLRVVGNKAVQVATHPFSMSSRKREKAVCTGFHIYIYNIIRKIHHSPLYDVILATLDFFIFPAWDQWRNERQ